MELSARLYNCARCHCQVVVCSECDRGNLYCAGGCARAARTLSLRASGKRYQSTRRGRFKHAERQRRYRFRRKKVTHQGSPEPPPHDPLSTRSEASQAVVAVVDEAIHCHFCGRLCSEFLRSGYLHTTVPSRACDRKIIHRPSKFRGQAKRSEERSVGTECRSRLSPYH